MIDAVGCAIVSFFLESAESAVTEQDEEDLSLFDVLQEDDESLSLVDLDAFDGDAVFVVAVFAASVDDAFAVLVVELKGDKLPRLFVRASKLAMGENMRSVFSNMDMFCLLISSSVVPKGKMLPSVVWK